MPTSTPAPPGSHPQRSLRDGTPPGSPGSSRIAGRHGHRRPGPGARGWAGGGGRGTSAGPRLGTPGREGRDSVLVHRCPPACPSSTPTEGALAVFNVLSVSVRECARTWSSGRSQVRPPCAGIRSSPLGDEGCQGVCDRGRFLAAVDEASACCRPLIGLSFHSAPAG